MLRISISLIFILIIHKSCSKNEEYILNSRTCKIPDINPFNDEVINMMTPQSYVSCNNNSELLTFVRKMNDSVVLHLRSELLPPNSTCVYCRVERHGSAELPDQGINLSNCRHLHKSVILSHPTVKVSCTKFSAERNLTEVVYENVHSTILVKESVKHKLQDYGNSTKPFSVMFVVVDSISRLNFIRTMSQTYNFLRENNFIEMKGYTKVADNTFPNFMALLTGLNLGQSYKQCNPRKIEGLDNCSMIWYDYRDNGYITAYAEDNAPIATFNYYKKGFKNPPTDYYFKPYVEATETLGLGYVNSMPYCTGPETAGERILNLAKDFAITFQNQSTFGVFWMNTFSHDEINAPYTMDVKMKQFFADIKKEGILENTIIIFLSDHGIRFGSIKMTRSGWFEERMPVNMISIPRSFQEKFPREYDNLKKNSHKLTNTYDMYMTLQHILTLSGISYDIKESMACPKCTSLFKKIPSSRSCEQAGIQMEWCTCMGHFHIIDQNHQLVKNATAIALEESGYYSCLNYFSIETISSSLSEPVPYNTTTRYLFVVFQTKPNEIVFLTTVKFQETIDENSSFYTRRFDNMDYCA